MTITSPITDRREPAGKDARANRNIFLAQLATYVAKGFHREAFLLALCGAGSSVHNALHLELTDIGFGSKWKESEFLFRLSQKFDSLYYGAVEDFAGLLQNFSALRTRMTAVDPEDERVFLSRQGTKPPTLRSAERWIVNASTKCGLLQWLTLRQARCLVRDHQVRKSSATAVLRIESLADVILRKAFTLENDFEDAKQELRLRLLTAERRKGASFLPTNAGKLVWKVARGVRNDIVSHRRALRVISIPHYDWIAAPDERQIEQPLVGLSRVHAKRFRGLQRRFIRSFKTSEQEVVSLLYGLAKSGRSTCTHSVWDVARMTNKPLVSILRIESKAAARAARLAKRSSLVIETETRRSYRRSVGYELDQLAKRGLQ